MFPKSLAKSSFALVLGLTCVGGVSAMVPAAAGADEASQDLHPPIAIRFTLREPGFVTLAIDDAGGGAADGTRVRNLVSEQPFPAGDDVAWWDGLDDLGRDTDAAAHAIYHVPGKLVAPGKYRVHGLVRPALDLRYEMTPYNQGSPPWPTKDRASEWLANHTAPSAALFLPPDAAPEREGHPAPAGQVLVGSFVSEGGSGLAWLDTEGRKVHGQLWVGGVWTGATHLARDAGNHAVPGVYAYTAAAWPGDKYNGNRSELRLFALLNGAAKKPAPGDARMGTGEDRPVLSPNYHFAGNLGDFEKNGGYPLGGIAARNGIVVASLKVSDQLLFVDAAAGEVLGTAPMPEPRGIAFDAQGRLLVLSGRSLVRLTLPRDLPAHLTPGPLVALDRTGWAASAGVNIATAQNALAKDPSKRWDTAAAQAPGQWFSLDLGTPRRLTTVVLDGGSSDDYPRGYEVYLSDDGQSWGKPVAEGAGTRGKMVITLPRATARYLRIVQTKQANNFWSIYDIGLYDTRDRSADVPTARLADAQALVAQGLQDPQGLALSSAGDIFISDWGESHQVKVFDPDGKFLRAIGNAGRPGVGPYNPKHMNHPNGVTFDGQGRLWVAETDKAPKRVSVWSSDGKLIQALYGPPAYGGGGWLDPLDKTRFFYADEGGGMELKLDWEHGTSRPVSVYCRPDFNETGDAFDSGHTPETPIHVGGRDYLVDCYNSNPTAGIATATVWQLKDGIATQCAAVGQANDSPLFNDTARFSARWTGQVVPQFSEEYSFVTRCDDGARLWVDGKKIIDLWKRNGGEAAGSIPLQAGRRYDIKLEYFQHGGGASAHLLWSSPSQKLQAIPSSQLFPTAGAQTGVGLSAEHFHDADLKEPALTRVDRTVDFNWGTGGLKLRLDNPYLARLPQGADLSKDRIVFAWSDRNDDGKVEPDEVTAIKGDTLSVNVMPDLSVVTGTALLFKPAGFSAGGAPLYDAAKTVALLEGAQRPTSSGGGQALLGADGRLVLTVAPKPFAPQSVGGAVQGKATWSYPSLWPGLHASHNAPMPDRPGELIGTTRLLGTSVTPRGSDLGELWAVNGNKGNIYLLTTDGLFVATLFVDSRTGSWSFPQARRGMPVGEASLTEENFWPSITQTADGAIYMPAYNGSIVSLTGLEGARRLSDSMLDVTAPQLAAAQAYFAQAELRRQQGERRGPARLTIALRPTAPAVDGKLNDWADADWAVIDQRTTQVGDWGHHKAVTSAALAISGDRLFAAFKTDDPKLLDNAGDSLPMLFKTGGALDLMIGADPAADPKRTAAAPGDERLLVARVKGKAVAVLYRPLLGKAGGAASGAAQPVPFSSPLRTIRFDRVEDVSTAVSLAEGIEKDPKTGADTTVYEFSIPLTALGLEPRASQTIRGDLGVLRGNGFQTLQRVYWNNKATGLVSDLPTEAELTPSLWGEFNLK